MATKLGLIIFSKNSAFNTTLLCGRERFFHTSTVCSAVQSGKYKSTPRKNKPLTYEQSQPPYEIGVKKAWNSWNTTTIEGGLRSQETAIEDIFIRKFIAGTFINLLGSEIIIKRQYNIIRIAVILVTKLSAERFCFLIGYTEEFLSHWLQCIVKLEVQMIDDIKAVQFKLI